ncbi:MAG: RDD family protein [Brooklawnia sp.]
MSQSSQPNQPLPQSGWYPDPAAAGQYRYWDGMGWTDQTRPVVEQPQPVAQWAVQQPTQPAADQAYASYPAGPSTADGVPLAGWWARGGALLIDLLLVGLLVALAAFPFYDTLTSGINLLIDDLWRATQTGGVQPDPYDPRYGLVEVTTRITWISAAIGFVYATGMQMWRGGTLGMLAIGLRVVPMEEGRRHHGLPLREALIRNVVYQLLSAFSIAAFINYLLPLGNRRRQTLHDMAGRTQVVKIR